MAHSHLALLTRQLARPLRAEFTYMLVRDNSANLRKTCLGMHKVLKGAQSFLYTLTLIPTTAIVPVRTAMSYAIPVRTAAR